MAQEVTVSLWCDPHLQSSQPTKVPATFSGDVTIGEETRHLELCADCENALVSPLLETMLAFGSRTEPNTSRPAKKAVTPGHKNATGPDGARLECPICTENGDPKDFKNRGSLSFHMKTAALPGHGVSTAEWEAQQRGVEPVKFSCPECAAKGEVWDTVTAGGLGKHRLEAHGVPGSGAKAVRRQQEAQLALT